MPSKILIVDDEPGVVGLLERILLEEGFDVVTALDGMTALKILSKQRIDAMFLDLIMPFPDGYEILHYLRKDPKRPIIIVISGVAHMTTLEDLKKVYPIFDVLHKPFNTQEIKQIIEKLKLQRKNMSIVKKMLDWRTWLLGMWAAVVGGTMGTLAGMVALPETVNFNHLGNLGKLALTTAVSHAILYLARSPLPKEVDVPMDVVETTVKTITKTPSQTIPPGPSPEQETK